MNKKGFSLVNNLANIILAVIILIPLLSICIRDIVISKEINRRGITVEEYKKEKKLEIKNKEKRKIYKTSKFGRMLK